MAKCLRKVKATETTRSKRIPSLAERVRVKALLCRGFTVRIVRCTFLVVTQYLQGPR